ncbi:MAG: glycosyltransferase family A protein, partial [Pontimonas sp.]
MSEYPLLTVAVAMFQSEDTIARALNSIYQQGFHDCEVVVVNDGSSDNSLQVAQSVPLPHAWRSAGPTPDVRFVNHPQNLGLGPARNTAATAARGKYVVFVDSDD